jgi:hypothetical protein
MVETEPSVGGEHMQSHIKPGSVGRTVVLYSSVVYTGCSKFCQNLV